MTPSTPVPTEQTEAEAQAILDELEQSFSVVEADTINAISVVNLEYPDVASMFSVDEDAWVFEVRYFDGADRVRIEQYLAAITAIGMTTEYPIEVGTAPFSTAALMAMAAEIASGSGTWPDVTGGEVGMLTAYQDHGHISVWVRERDGDDTIEVDGISITFMSVPADWEPPYSLQ